MNLIALVLLAIAAGIELEIVLRGFFSTPRVRHTRDLVAFLFITGFILVYMLQFWIVPALGSGSVLNGS